LIGGGSKREEGWSRLEGGFGGIIFGLGSGGDVFGKRRRSGTGTENPNQKKDAGKREETQKEGEKKIGFGGRGFGKIGAVGHQNNYRALKGVSQLNKPLSKAKSTP